MKYNYPVKYAAMPIIEQVGWGHGLNELEREYDVVCYIVSKCYQLNDKTKYSANGKKEKEYEVVFPYQKREYYDWERVTPSFNVFSHECTNSNLVEKVFDNYEEALEFVTEKNKELCKENMRYLSWTEDFAEQISKETEKFEDKLAKYKMLEQQILINTSDLDQSNVKELDYLIVKSEGKIKVLSNNLYEYLNYSSYSKFIVYSISLEQYDKLVTLINTQDTFDISKVIENASPILYHNYEGEEEDVMVINQDGNILFCINEWENLESNEEQKIPPVELSSIGDDVRHLFTTETLEDIILSFSDYKYINLKEIYGPILKKSLFDKNKK